MKRLFLLSVIIYFTWNTNAQQIYTGSKIDPVFIQSANNYYNENLRLFPSTTNDYSSVVLGAVSGNSGTGIGQWTLVRYPSTFDYLFGIRYNSTDYFNIANNGCVGVGTKQPLGKLHIDAGNNISTNGKVLIRSSSNSNGQVQILNPTGAESSIGFIGMGTGFGNSAQSSEGDKNVWVIGTNIWHNGGNVFGIGNKEYATLTGDGQILGVNSNGNVTIGTSDASNYKLNVWGKLRAHEIVVNTSGADYVFDDNFQLFTLDELELYIKENKHLPDLKPAGEMQEEGVAIGDLQTKLLQKVEELTLYILQQNKKIHSLEGKIDKLESNVSY